ncbi:MAG: hypothetical protein ACTSX7_00240 [Alphaproteobacteria bacterium]
MALLLPVPVFIATNLALGISQFVGIDDSAGIANFLRFFDLDAEQTVPAWYSTILLALAAFTTCAVALTKQTSAEPFVKHWYALAGVFLYLSMDEALAIHERTILPLRSHFQLDGLLLFSWVIPATIIVAIMGIAYLRFLLAMPQRLQRNLIIAAIAFVGGALILEMVGGLFYDIYGPGVITALTAITEEVAEMVGVIWYIYALTDHLLVAQTDTSPLIGALKAPLSQ